MFQPQQSNPHFVTGSILGVQAVLSIGKLSGFVSWRFMRTAISPPLTSHGENQPIDQRRVLFR